MLFWELDQEMSVHERLAWSKNRAHLHFLTKLWEGRIVTGNRSFQDLYYACTELDANWQAPDFVFTGEAGRGFEA